MGDSRINDEEMGGLGDREKPFHPITESTPAEPEWGRDDENGFKYGFK